MRNIFKMALLASVAWSGQALSQATERGVDSRVDEIVVTAKLREERLQDVPLSITAFSGAGLEQRQILDVRDLARFTPNIGFYSGSGRGDPSALTVRGLSANTSDERYQGLAIFVDGIFQSGQLTSIDLSQLERVEVLRGPQSATFGRSTYAGAIDYITRNPSLSTPEGRARVQVSSEEFENFNRVVNVRVSTPLVQDKVALQLNGTYSFRDGRSFNRSTVGIDAGQPIGQEETFGFGALLFARPTETLSVKARFAYDSDRDSAPLLHIIEPAEWEAKGKQSFLTPGGQIFIRGPLPYPTLGATGGGEFNNGFARPNTLGRDRDRYFASLIVEKELGDRLVLSYRGGFFSEHYFANVDFLYRPATNDIFFGNATNVKSRTLAGTGSAADRTRTNGNAIASDEYFINHSHQLRLVSNGEVFRYKLGVYYFKEWDRNYQFSNIRPTNPLGQSRGAEVAENLAGFAGIDVTLGGKLTLSAEGRIERDIVRFDECGFCASTNVGQPLRSANTFFSPRFTASYKISPTNLIYAQVARGFKSARLNTTARTLPTAAPERLDNYEIGSKNTIADGRVLINIAGFYNEIKNQQAFIPLPNPNTAPGQPIQITGVGSFGNSRIYGAELETSLVVARGLKLNAAVGYADHKYTQAVGPLSDTAFFPVGGTVQGKTSVNTPKWTASGSVDYSTPIGNGLIFDARADATWRSKMFVDRANLAWIEPAAQIGAKVGVRTDDGTWTASVFGRNLFDNKTALGAGLSGSSSCFFDQRPNARCLTLTIPRGREIGLDVAYKF